MAEKKKEQQNMSKRDAYRERFAKRNSDIDMEDEDAYYDRLGKMMDEYETFENNARVMSERLGKSPLFSEMVVAAGKQDDFDPMIYLVENGGLDIESLRSDPEYSKKLAEARGKYMDKITEGKKIEEQLQANMPKSMEAVRNKAKELGLDDAKTGDVIESMYKIMDDLIVGIIDPAVFEMVAKGQSYDNDMESARQAGQAEGLKAKVEDKLRSLPKSSERNAGRQMAMQPQKPARPRPHNPFREEDE